jgi:hypothetical protein
MASKGKKKKLRTNKKKNNCSKGRSRLMNEDVMTKMLSYLSVEELLRLERVSQQFKYCVNEVLKRQKGLSIGKRFNDILCVNKNHSTFGGNVTNAFVTKEVNSKENQNNLKSILKKCINIKCLYLNKSLDFKTIEIIVKSCERLECLFFDEIFVLSKSRLERIGPLFSKSTIFHLEIHHSNGNQRIDEKNASIVRNMPFLTKLQLFQWTSIRNTIECVRSKNIHHLDVMIWKQISDAQQQEDIDSVVSLINRNEQIFHRLSISTLSLTDQAINNIDPNKLDLIDLSINCRNLSFGSVVNLVKSQKMLQNLRLSNCNFVTYERIENLDFTSKVRGLSLSSCRFTPKQFLHFIQLFRILDTFNFYFSSFCCECIPIADENICNTCKDCGFNALSRVSTIKRLTFMNLKSETSFIDSIPNYNNLNTISLSICFPFDLGQFIGKCLNLAQRNPTKLFTIKLYAIASLKGLPKKLPKNVRLFIH